MVAADVEGRRRSPRAAIALLVATMAVMSPSAVSAQAVLPAVIALPPGCSLRASPRVGGRPSSRAPSPAATSSPSTASPATATSPSTRRRGAPRPASSRTGGGACGSRAGGRGGPTSTRWTAPRRPRSRSARRRRLRQPRGDDRRRRGSPTRSMTSCTRSRSTRPISVPAGGGAPHGQLPERRRLQPQRDRRHRGDRWLIAVHE